jgi:hypothetical protein
MSISGSSSQWIDLLDNMLPELLQLVVDTWEMLQGPLINDREDTITLVLCRALRNNRTYRDLWVTVDTQIPELDPALGQNLGRQDLVFRPTGGSSSPNEEIYLCVECKRLNFMTGNKKRSGGAEYVKEGMFRFVSGQYAKAVRNGGMLGYVLDGNVSNAIANVEANVKRHYATLYMDVPAELHLSSVLPDVVTARESLHRRQNGAGPFTIHHLFVKADRIFTNIVISP